MDTVSFPNSNLNIPNQVAYSRDATPSIELPNFSTNQDTNFDEHFDIESFMHNSSSLSTLPTDQIQTGNVDLNMNCTANEIVPTRDLNGYATGQLPQNPCNNCPAVEFLTSHASSSRIFSNNFQDLGNSLHENIGDVHNNTGFIQGTNTSLKSTENPSGATDLVFDNRQFNFQNSTAFIDREDYPCTNASLYSRVDNYLAQSTIYDEDERDFSRSFSSTVLSNNPEPKFNDNSNFLNVQNQSSIACNWPQVENEACAVGNNDANNDHFSNSANSRTDSNDTDVNDSLDIGNNEVQSGPSSSKLTNNENRNSSKKTAYNEKWGVKVFKAWCAQNKISEEFEKLTAEGLNDLLTKFWKSIRKSNGDYYGRNSLFNLRAMINKHLKGNPYFATFDIVTDDRFRLSNECLDEQLKRLKSLGRTIAHKVPISPSDIQKLYDSTVFSTTTPISLLRKVWFEVTLHFCPKGGESQEKIKKSTFKIFVDEGGRRYVARTVSTKQEGKNEARMYDTYTSLCPVKSFEFYLSKLHPMQPRLFQQPRKKTSENSVTWYGKSPIGEKALQQMMANISIEASLSKRYTNHCVRTTALQQFTELRKQYEALESASVEQAGLASTSTCLNNGSRPSTSHHRPQAGRVDNLPHRNSGFSREVNEDVQASGALNFYQQSSLEKHFVNQPVSNYNHVAENMIGQQQDSFHPNSNFAAFLDKSDNGFPKKSFFSDPAPLPPSYSEHEFDKQNLLASKRMRLREAPDMFYQSQNETNFSDASHSNTFLLNDSQPSSHLTSPQPYLPFHFTQNVDGKEELNTMILPTQMCSQDHRPEPQGRKKIIKMENTPRMSKTIVTGFSENFVDPNAELSKNNLNLKNSS